MCHFIPSGIMVVWYMKEVMTRRRQKKEQAFRHIAPFFGSVAVSNSFFFSDSTVKED